ncbi:MAG: fumarylacetoacetate hydrolase family protein [Thermoleophilaceae bacterium]|nr:fumarylacetoacetate hydrolase family protein [Thermoleophilaceae bacterium]
MRLVSYEAGGAWRAGVVRGEALVALEAPVGPAASSGLAGLLQVEGALERALEDATGEGLPLAHARLGPPITHPGKIVCIGLNYGSHVAEQGAEPPATPTFFAKFRNSLAPPGAEVPLPPASEKVDYEAEVAFVIGRRCRDVDEADALSHLAGYMLFNDLSARDLQFATPQWLPGKVFDGSAPCGPWLVTPDEAGAHDAIEIELTLNGERMQSASTSDLVHSVPALTSHLSRLMTLEPGDVVSTGTPAGVGSLREPKRWLKAGDEVVVSSPTLGRLETRIGAPGRLSAPFVDDLAR